MKAFEKLFSIINYLEENKEARLQEIYTYLGITKSTAHRMLSILSNHHLVIKNAETKKYSLGIGFVQIAISVLENLDIRKIAGTYLNEINEETCETVHLAQLIDDQVVYIDKRESTHMIRMYSHIGKNAPIHCTGVGKAIMAFQEKQILERILAKSELERYTDNTITTEKMLLQELREIRKNGYALDREEHEEHIICIAAPIRDHNGLVVASLSVTTMLHRKKLEDLIMYKDTLISKCREISKKMGCSDNE